MAAESERLYRFEHTIAAGNSASAAALDLTLYKPIAVIFPTGWTNCDVLLWSGVDPVLFSWLTAATTGLRLRLVGASALEQHLLPPSWFITTRYLFFICHQAGTETLLNQPNTCILTIVCKKREDSLTQAIT